MLRELKKIKNITYFFPLIIQWSELPAFLCLCSFSIGIFTFQISSINGFFIKNESLLFILSFLGIASGILISKKYIRILLFFISGFTLTNFEYINTRKINICIDNLSPKQHILSGVIVSSPFPTKDFISFNLRVEKIDTISKSVLYGKIIRMLTKERIPLRMGKIVVKGYIYSYDESNVRELLDKYGYFKPYNINATFFIDSIVYYKSTNKFLANVAIHIREKIYKIIAQYDNPQHRALIRAVFLGEKGFLVPEVKEAFFRSGLSHLLALSGLHAGILLAAVYLMLSLFPISKSVKHILAIVVLWGYLFFVGFIPSLTRATVMCTVVILTLLFEKKNYPLQSLGVAGLGWLIFSPSSIFDIGFQLSYSSTFGILALYPLFKDFLFKNPNDINFFLKKIFILPILISFSALITTLPFLFYHFKGFSIYGMLGNIFSTLLMSIAMWTFFVAIIIDIVFPFLTHLFLKFSSLFLDLLIFVVEGATKVSFSYCKIDFWMPEFIPIYYLILIGIITIVKEKRVFFVNLTLPLFFIFIPLYYLLINFSSSLISVYVTNTLTTSTTSIIWPNRKIWIICSGEEEKVLESLSKKFIPYVNLIPTSKIERIIIVDTNSCLIDSVIGKNKACLDNTKNIKVTKESLGAFVNISLDSTSVTISIVNKFVEINFKTNGKYLLICHKHSDNFNKIPIPAIIYLSTKGQSNKNIYFMEE